MLPRFEVVARRRPVELVAPGPVAPFLAPYVAATGPGDLALGSGRDRLVARYDGTSAWLEVTTAGRTTRHRSRRFARAGQPVRELGLALTGTHLTVLTRGPGPWLARGRVDLRDRIDTHAEDWLAGLVADAPVSGRFGQLGLRDVRVVDGAPDGRIVLSATSAGPGFFDTAHTSLWEVEPRTLALTHLSDVFFRRPDRPGAYGDHATHVLRDGDRWLVATSTWGDFDKVERPVSVTLASTTADLLVGAHLLDTVPLALPTDGLRSVGVWDPHLARTDDGWLVGYVSATRYFSFHPVLSAGPSLDALSLRAVGTGTQTEGTTLLHHDGAWRVLVSDGVARRHPVLDLDLRETGVLDAPYPSNIPWPTVVRDGDSWLMVTFNGRRSGGALPGYGTHGDLVFLRAPAPSTV